MMTEQDRYTELYETWCRVDLINLIIKLEEAISFSMGRAAWDELVATDRRQHNATNTNSKH